MFKSFSLFQNVALYFLLLDSGYGKGKYGAKVVFLFLIGGHLFYNIVLVSTIQSNLNQPQVYIYPIPLGFLHGSDDKESACSAGDRVQSLSWEDPLEKGMAADSSILAWRIPWTEEPGALQSMGSQRAGHD